MMTKPKEFKWPEMPKNPKPGQLFVDMDQDGRYYIWHNDQWVEMVDRKHIMSVSNMMEDG